MSSNGKHHAWEPLREFPLPLAVQSLPSLVGILLAATEHLQQRAVRSYKATLSERLHSAAIARPAMHVHTLLERAHVHLSRSRLPLGVEAYDGVLDELACVLPPKLPLFVPKSDRYEAERSYRIAYAHLADSFALFRKAFEDVGDDEPEGEES